MLRYIYDHVDVYEVPREYRLFAYKVCSLIVVNGIITMIFV